MPYFGRNFVGILPVPRTLPASLAEHIRALRRSVLEQTAKPSHAAGLVLRKYFGQ